jgi:hypothetical protein
MNNIFILLNFILYLCQSDHIDQLGSIITPPGFVYNGWDMTWFPADIRAGSTQVNNVVSPNNDLLIFDTDMIVLHGIGPRITGDPSFEDPVYFTGEIDDAQLKMTFPPDTNALIFFLSSNNFDIYNFTLSYPNGDSIIVTIDFNVFNNDFAHAFAISRHNINGFPSGITISDQTPDPPSFPEDPTTDSRGFYVSHFLINQKSCSADPCECQPGRVCGNYPLREIDDVESAADCCYLCQSFTSEKRRKCRSFDYYEIGKECRLFDHVCQDTFVEDCHPVNPFIVGGNINYKFHAY